MTALAIGTALALVALVVVLYPLFVDRPRKPVPAPRRASASAPEHGELPAVQALREVEFDRETGKLSERDYAALKAAYTREALAELRAADAPATSAAPGGVASAAPGGVASTAPGGVASTAPTDEELEATIARFRAAPVCAGCGLRPELDALYCSSCGRWLGGACGKCGVAVTEADARYCGSCGHQLAA